VKKNDLIPHLENALQLLDKLETIKLDQVPRSANKMVDAQPLWHREQKRASPYWFVVNGSSHLQKTEIKKRSKQFAFMK